MASIKVSGEVKAPLDRVWGIISDIDRDPRYWQDLHSVTNIQQNGNIIERTATVGFRKARSTQTVILDPERSVRIVMTKGPIIGNKSIQLTQIDDGKTQVDVVWDIELSGIPGFMRGSVEKRLAKGTEEALNRIEEAV
jgi:carbon monoxide dehydrogenase subunit G